MSKRIVSLVMSVMLVMATFAVTIPSPRASAQDDGVPPEVMQLALQGVESNEDWEPYVQEIDGVEMVLVPAGCFTMGSTDTQAEVVGLAQVSGDEKPAHQQCFDQPFWIDKYEVTNAQFAQFDGVAASKSRWKDDTLPRETINWFEARDFCALRGGHLPTEAEWEYAARGPDSLIFPWGNTFVAENVVYADNSNKETAEVGSKPDGASWVGALDMSGNVGEWTSSIFMDYPYDATDGREDSNNSHSSRVLRGGEYTLGVADMRSAVRSGQQYSPFAKGWLHGARCAQGASSSSYRVVVPGTDNWVDTGLLLDNGQEFAVSASGEVCTYLVEGECYPGSTSGPEGQPYFCEEANCILPNAPYGILLGRIGAGAPFAIGTGGIFNASQAGIFQLSVNDNDIYFSDNPGGFTVDISVTAPR